jgi:cellulose synthase (UDP-forming)
MVQYLIALVPTFLVLAFFLLGAMSWPAERTWARTTVGVIVFLLALRYLYWRFTETVLPQPFDGFEFVWVWLLFAVEILAFLEVSLFMLTMSRYVDRVREADRLEAAMRAQRTETLPTADVFIPTYNEPLDVLERTIIGARALDYPADKLRICVLDDGRRAWLREFCAAKGVQYITRPDNAHAKAGNINNGLRHSSGQFVAIFDADFVPHRNFLYRTLGFFTDPKIGIVQTPQHFFNKDPVQSNLWIENHWPDEQRLFFDEMAPSRDAWNVSFCCGSCSVMRREAIDSIGGIPTDSITEDLLTTLACLNKGYITRYLNERLSIGLAAEDLAGFFIQRSRWCRGGIQTLFVPNGPVFGSGLTLFQRIMFLPVSWLVQYLVRFFGLIVPPVYLLTGLSPLFFTSVDDMVSNQLPVLVAYLLFMRWIAPHKYLPVVSSAIGAFSTFRMLPVVIASLVRPFGEPFRVTPKGVAAGGSAFDTYTFTCVSLVLVATAIGLFSNVVPEWSAVREHPLSIIVHYWGGLNIVVLGLAAMICFETPRAADGGFATDEPARLVLRGEVFPARLVGVSLDRSTVRAAANLSSRAGDTASLELTGVAPFRVRIGVSERTAVGPSLSLVHDDMPAQTRDQMIAKLYTGAYSQEIDTLRSSRIFGGLWLRAFGKLERAAGA